MNYEIIQKMEVNGNKYRLDKNNDCLGMYSILIWNEYGKFWQQISKYYFYKKCLLNWFEKYVKGCK